MSAGIKRPVLNWQKKVDKNKRDPYGGDGYSSSRPEAWTARPGLVALKSTPLEDSASTARLSVFRAERISATLRRQEEKPTERESEISLSAKPGFEPVTTHSLTHSVCALAAALSPRGQRAGVLAILACPWRCDHRLDSGRVEEVALSGRGTLFESAAEGKDERVKKK